MCTPPESEKRLGCRVEKAALALRKLEGRRLKVELKSVSKMLRALAEDPLEADPKQLGSAAVAFLRHREQVSWSA